MKVKKNIIVKSWTLKTYEVPALLGGFVFVWPVDLFPEAESRKNYNTFVFISMLPYLTINMQFC